MTNFKNKMDDMFGDTSKQEARIAQHVRQQIMLPPPKRRTWQLPVITSLATALVILLIASTIGLNPNSADTGHGTPYDPLDDLVDVIAQKQKGLLSTYDFQQFESLPTIQSVSALQYVDREVFEVDDQSFQAVIERKPAIFNEVSYKQGAIVRTTADAGSHLPIYENEFYEVIAVPGDRIILENGRLRINGKRASSALLDKYEEMNVQLVGGYEQKLNAREYLLLNYFPYKQSAQPVTITAVHKIYGEVVAKVEQSAQTAYQLPILQNAPDLGPEAYFDLFLYHSIFGDAQIAQGLTREGSVFPYSDRVRQYFIEAGYRNVTYVSDNEAIIRYDYEREGGSGYQFTMFKQPNTNIWQWGLQ